MADDFAEAMADLNSITVALQASSHDAVMQAGTVVKASAARCEALGKQFAPVDTGAMRNSIGRDFLGYANSQVAAEIGPTVEYAPFVEFGTHRMAPRAFMGPAGDIVGADMAPALLSIVDPIGTGS